MRYMSNGATGSRTTPLGQSASNLDALLEMDLAVSSKFSNSSFGGQELKKCEIWKKKQDML